MKNKYLLLMICLTTIASVAPEIVWGSVVVKQNFKTTQIEKSKLFNTLVLQNLNNAETYYNLGNTDYELKDYQAA
ncbi:MAG: hypothetical protein ACRC80_10065, partial [Waterburya sp.]